MERHGASSPFTSFAQGQSYSGNVSPSFLPSSMDGHGTSDRGRHSSVEGSQNMNSVSPLKRAPSKYGLRADPKKLRSLKSGFSANTHEQPARQQAATPRLPASELPAIKCPKCKSRVIKGIQCENEQCGHWWHFTCAGFKGGKVPQEHESWYCRHCRGAQSSESKSSLVVNLQTPLEDLASGAPKRVPKDNSLFDDLFTPRTSHLQLEDHKVESRMRQIDRLIMSVADCYSNELRTLKQEPNFKINEHTYPELTNKVRMAFGIPDESSLVRGLLMLPNTNWKIIHMFQAILAVIVQDWVFDSWFPKILSPDGCVQEFLNAIYKMGQERGKAAGREAMEGYCQEVLMDLTRKPKVREDIAAAAKEFAASTMEVLGPLTKSDLRTGIFHSGAVGDLESSSELIRKLDELFLAALELTLDFRMRPNGTEFFWARPNDMFDQKRIAPHNQIVTREDGRRDRRVSLGLLPGVLCCGDGGQRAERRVLSKAIVILELQSLPSRQEERVHVDAEQSKSEGFHIG